MALTRREFGKLVAAAVVGGVMPLVGAGAAVKGKTIVGRDFRVFFQGREVGRTIPFKLHGGSVK